MFLYLEKCLQDRTIADPYEPQSIFPCEFRCPFDLDPFELAMAVAILEFLRRRSAIRMTCKCKFRDRNATIGIKKYQVSGKFP